MSSIKNIFIAESSESLMESISTAELISGQGVVGDRYLNGTGTFSKKLAGLPDVELTLIESEEIDSFNVQFNYQFGYGEFRRNIVTTGVRLNDFEGKEVLAKVENVKRDADKDELHELNQYSRIKKMRVVSDPDMDGIPF